MRAHFQYIGPISLLAGPDLAISTLDPIEFSDFLRGRLARRFIDGPKVLESRLSEMDVKPDLDGRFRITDFFCHNATWQMVLSKLITRSDVILMDLRGFSNQHAGCQYELKELIDLIPLQRVVAIIDDTTDAEFLRKTVFAFWSQMNFSSPNMFSTSNRLTLFHLKNSDQNELHQLLKVILRAIERGEIEDDKSEKTCVA